MTAYMQSDDGTIVRDFAQRTLHNLRFIEQQYKLFRDGQSDTEVYEVTQLINSMLGLLVFPKETFWQYLKPLTFEQIPADVCPFRKSDKAPNLPELIRLIRNSFSHFNLEIKYGAGYITRIKMHNEKKSGEINWQDEVSVFDLRKFVEWFITGVIDSSLLTKKIEDIKAA